MEKIEKENLIKGRVYLYDWGEQQQQFQYIVWGNGNTKQKMVDKNSMKVEYKKPLCNSDFFDVSTEEEANVLKLLGLTPVETIVNSYQIF